MIRISTRFVPIHGHPVFSFLLPVNLATEKTSDSASQLPSIGWREWVTLGGLRIPRIKAKIDTGARSSSIHALDIETFDQDGSPFVRFKVHPIQRSERRVIQCQSPVHDIRSVRSSSGEASERIVIVTQLAWNRQRWPIEVTLADRTQMGFRMLIGREALMDRLVVNVSRSFVGGVPKRKKR